MPLNPQLEEQVQAWLTQDPDEVTRAELSQLLSHAETDETALSELENAFHGPLEFGTAGLRGKLGGGPNRMNRVVVQQAAAGLAQYLLNEGHHGESIVIGYDARFNSEVFAQDTADIFSAAGFTSYIFDHVVPTPVLAFAIRELQTCAGVMVTASHNPPQDNGYKVYLGDGRQIVPPADKDISEQIRKITDVRNVKKISGSTFVEPYVEEKYIAALAAAINAGPTTSSQRGDVVSVYTAMHGVGWNSVHEATTSCDFKVPHPVVAQRDPDPLFPTVAFPNPEEKGALDLAVAQAQQLGADVLLANDPDADRLAVALPLTDGSWKTLHGDQVGCLLAWWVIERAKRTETKLTGAMGSSIVSSMLLEHIAHDAGLDYTRTLTGFKWVSRVPNLIFGYEEALGYCVNPKYVGDKDGVSAVTYFLELVAALKDEGRTCWDVLDEIAAKFGLYSSIQVSVKVSDLSLVPNIMGALRSSPPKQLGEFAVVEVHDLAKGYDGLPATDGVILMLSGNAQIERARVIVRPSGTEPKIKCYLEVVATSSNLEQAQRDALTALSTLAEAAKPLLS